jgi:predicted translin family RNA/ssDNA-binding protein
LYCFYSHAQYPTLRNGGFGNSLEEWAEGAITLEWVQHKRVPSMQELRLINAAEYIGALSDFTGEIGRLAVMHAGKRDFASVRCVMVPLHFPGLSVSVDVVACHNTWRCTRLCTT